MLILVEFFSMYIYKPMRDACYAEVYCVEKLGAKLRVIASVESKVLNYVNLYIHISCQTNKFFC
jgi:hypothetical protein